MDFREGWSSILHPAEDGNPAMEGFTERSVFGYAYFSEGLINPPMEEKKNVHVKLSCKLSIM